MAERVFVISNLMIFPKFDQQKVLHYALTSRDLHRYSAHQILMSWVMDLPKDVEPSVAAKAILDVYLRHEDLVDGEQQREVIKLLREVCEVELLGDKKPRRRGGRSARLNR